MKKILPCLLSFIPCLVFSQGILNYGGKIVTTSGAFITLTGNNSNFKNDIQGSSGTVDNAGTISLQGDWNNAASNNVFINPGVAGKVIFNGTGAQNILGATKTNFEKLTINNVTGVAMQQSENVSDSLNLISGPLTLNSSSLIVTTAAGSAISRSSGYIVSELTNNSAKVVWSIGTNTTAHTIPFGTVSGTYIPFVLTLASGDIGNVTVSTYPTAFNNTPYPTTPVTVLHMHDVFGNDNSANTVDRFWEIDKTGGGGNATLSFTAKASEVGVLTNLKAQRWNAAGLGWDPALPGQTSNALGAVVPGVSTFNSPWTLSTSTSPLPVQLLTFNAMPVNEQVHVSWTTVTQINNDYFTVEKSKDGSNFYTVATIDGAGNSNKTQQYSTEDYNPYSGVSYYRLKQTDFNGSYSYSKSVAVQFKTGNAFNASVYQGAPGSLNIIIEGAEGKNVSLKVTDMLGKLCYSNQVYSESNNFRLPLETASILKAGVYLFILSDGVNIQSKKIIIN